MQNDNSKFKISLKERAYNYAVKIVHFIDSLPREMSCQIMGKQLLRSATSVGANIIEAQAGSSRRDFANFMNHALKSANESIFWLGLLVEAKRIKNELADYLWKETHELSRILGASMLTLKGKRG